MTREQRTEWAHRYDERAAIMEHDGELAQHHAERAAEWWLRAAMHREGLGDDDVGRVLEVVRG